MTAAEIVFNLDLRHVGANLNTTHLIMKYTYSIVYASDFQPIAQDGSNEFDDEKDAFFRLAYMDNEQELDVIRSDQNNCIYYRDGMDWIKVS